MLYIIRQGRVHAALRPSEKSSQGQRACNKFNGSACVPRGPDAHTDSQRDAEFIRALTRIAIRGDRGAWHLCVYAEESGRQAGATCEVFHAVHLDDSGRGLSGCPGDKRPRLA